MSDPDKQPIPIEKIKNLVFDVIVHRFGVDKGTLSESTNFSADLSANPKQEEDFKKEIEKVFGVTFKPEEKGVLTTAGTIISYMDGIFNK